MKLRKDKKTEDIKMNLWLDVYKNVAGLFNTEMRHNDISVPKAWADRAVKDFEESFNKNLK